VKNIGKPCAGEPHARFDEGGQGNTCSLLYPCFKALVPATPQKTTPALDLTNVRECSGEAKTVCHAKLNT